MDKRISLGLYTAMMMTAPAWAQQMQASDSTPSQSSVTIFGVIDTGVEYVRGVPTTGTNTGNQFRVGYGATPSRIGFRGVEDLGDGLRAVFVMEGGFSADTGASSQSRLFGRQANVGLEGNWGSLSFGRQYTMRYYGMLDADIFAAASEGLGSLDAGIPNARADNSVSYRTKYGPVSGGVNYSFGRDTASANNPTATNCPGESTDSHQCREWSWMLKYDGGNWGLVSSYERLYGGTSATYGGLTSPNLTDSRFTINAYGKVGNTQIGTGWLYRNNEGASTLPKSNLYWFVVSQQVATQVVVDGMVAQNKFNEANKATLLTLRGTYLFSKRTSVYLTLSQMKNTGILTLPVSTNSPGTPSLPGGTQQSIMAGVRHAF